MLVIITAILGDIEFSQSFSNETSYSVVADHKPSSQVTAMANNYLAIYLTVSFS